MSGQRVEQQPDEDRRKVADRSEVELRDQQDDEDGDQYREMDPSPWPGNATSQHRYYAEQKVADPISVAWTSRSGAWRY